MVLYYEKELQKEKQAARQHEHDCRELEIKLAAAEAAMSDYQTTLATIHEQTRPLATGENFWRG